jgi:predicted ferric reductase
MKKAIELITYIVLSVLFLTLAVTSENIWSALSCSFSTIIWIGLTTMTLIELRDKI